jgi:uncharacterized membrane protein
MTDPGRSDARPAPGSPDRRQGSGHTATTRAPAEDTAKPLSPALDKTFKIGLVLKGLDGVLEVAGGILLLFLSPQAIQHIARALTAHELSEDPHDLIARYLLHTTAHLHHGTTLFGAIYLLSHGIAKVVLVVLVLRDKLWAYPWLIGLLLAFIAYQLYQITAVHFSAGLTALTIFDAILVWLTWREYRAKRALQHQARAPVTAPSPGGHRPPGHSYQPGEPEHRARLSETPSRSATGDHATAESKDQELRSGCRQAGRRHDGATAATGRQPHAGKPRGPQLIAARLRR